MRQKSLTVENIQRTARNPNGKIEASFKTWDEFNNIMKNEKHFNIMVYYRLIKRYRHLIEIIERHNIKISRALPACPHWT